MKPLFKVSWFDIRDGYGIAVDEEGSEYYLSSDCCPPNLKSGNVITGVAYLLSGTPCLKEVVVCDNI